MKKIDFRQLLPHLIAAGIFILISLIYFSPLFEGKQLRQDDITRFEGMSKEISDYRAATGQEPLWTNSMFGGMPAYQISVLYPHNLVQYLDKILKLGLPHPANLLFLYLLGFYFLLITLKTDYRLAIGGAIAYAFSSYFFIIIDAGHNSKALALAYFPPVIAGVLMAYRGRMLAGAAITALAMSLELYANHVQITYYMTLTMLTLGFVFLASAWREKKIPAFFKASGLLLIASLLAAGPNITNLWATYEYGKYTTRGPSELTAKKISTGLDKDYALGWSYGVGETMTLLIPDFYGGSSSAELGTGSETYKTLEDKGISPAQAKSFIKSAPMYWGDQPFTSGPVYAGAIVCYLFVLGLFIAEPRYKWWLLSATALSMMLSWGKNFQWFTDIFFDHFPGYNKFRAVSMILVIAEFSMPLMGMLAIKRIYDNKNLQVTLLRKSMLRALYITAGLCLFFMLLPGALFDFTSSADEQMKSAGYPDWLVSAIQADRKSLLQSDAFRSFAFISLAFGILWLTLSGKVKKQYSMAVITLLFVFDMWTVNKRYLNAASFVSKSQAEKSFQPGNADLEILRDKDPDYRVLNLTVSTFNDASTSYFHKSVGGYHGAKLKRYQELIENHIAKSNMAVINMLNTRYLIRADEKTHEPLVHRNPDALGNAWFVKEFRIVENADSEINALSAFNPAQTAIVDKRFLPLIGNFRITPDSTTGASVQLKSYKPNDLIYRSVSAVEQMAVFSEIYYEKGWNAYVDGKLTPHFRANYVLRGMIIPSGSHTVEFKFEPSVYYTGEKIALACSILLFLLPALIFFREIGLPRHEESR